MIMYKVKIKRNFENEKKRKFTSVSYKKKQENQEGHSIHKLDNFNHFFPFFACNVQQTILSLYNIKDLMLYL